MWNTRQTRSTTRGKITTKHAMRRRPVCAAVFSAVFRLNNGTIRCHANEVTASNSFRVYVTTSSNSKEVNSDNMESWISSRLRATTWALLSYGARVIRNWACTVPYLWFVKTRCIRDLKIAVAYNTWLLAEEMHRDRQQTVGKPKALSWKKVSTKYWKTRCLLFVSRSRCRTFVMHVLKWKSHFLL